MVTQAPYGSWPSPVTPALLVENAVSLDWTGSIGGQPAWVESRPSEQGRSVLVALDARGKRHDVIPEGFSVRSSLQEYGGRCWAPWGDGAIFANWSDQRLYRVTVRTDGTPGVPEAITAEPPAPRIPAVSCVPKTPPG